jgi:hypothetical protein
VADKELLAPCQITVYVDLFVVRTTGWVEGELGLETIQNIYLNSTVASSREGLEMAKDHSSQALVSKTSANSRGHEMRAKIKPLKSASAKAFANSKEKQQALEI